MSEADVGGDPACWAHLFDEGAPEPGEAQAPADGKTNVLGRFSDRVLGQLMEALADAVVVSDTEGTIVYWNAAAERVFGWTADHAIGKSLELIIPERQREAHWAGYQRVMASGETRYGADLLRVPSLHADGQRRSIAFTVTLLTDEAGSVTGIAAVVRDETKRWAEEQDLRRQLREAGQGATATIDP